VRPRAEFTLPDAPEYCEASADGSTVAVASARTKENWPGFSVEGNYGPVRILDLATGRERACVGEAGRQFLTLSLSPDGAWLAVEDGRGNLELWDTATGRLWDTIHTDWYTTFALKFAPGGRWLELGRKNNLGVPMVELYDLAALRVVLTRESASGWFTPDGGTLVMTDQIKGFLFRDVATSRERPLVRPSGWPPQTSFGAPTFSRDGSRMAAALELWDFQAGGAGFERAGVQVWDVRREAVAPGPALPWSRERVLELEFSPDGRLLVASSERQTRVWDIAAEPPREVTAALVRRRRQPAAHFDRLPSNSPVFSPDGTRVLVDGDTPGTFRLLDVASREPRATVRLHRSHDECSGLTFSPDGRVLAARLRLSERDLPTDRYGWAAWLRQPLAWRTYHSVIQLFDTATGRELAVLPGCANFDTPVLMFTPDGRGLWTTEPLSLPTGSTLTFRLWDVSGYGPPSWLRRQQMTAVRP
jgi:WD40 repeat protein